jgi:hypothetical protein
MSRVPWNNISDSVQGGSAQPEWWLSNFGQVAQGKPEYSSKNFASILIILFCLLI